jgi:uncharacterized delta-60 repeat protein
MVRLESSLAILLIYGLTLFPNARASVRLDPAFGQGGTLITYQTSIADHVRRMKVQPDGKILVLATSTVDIIGVPREAAIFRYDASGLGDPTFGAGGTIRMEGLRDFDMLPDGRIVVVITDYGYPAAARVCRYTANGAIDKSFGSFGCVFAGGQGRHEGRKIKVQPDGRVVIVGMTEGGGFAARITSNGQLDPSFDTDGVAYGWGTDFAYTLLPPWTLDSNGDVAIQSDGKIVYGLGGGWGQVYYLARLNYDGSIDTSFGDGSGLVASYISVPGYPYDTFSFGIVPQANGDLLAIGTAVGWNGDSNWNIIRLGPNGREIDSFESSSADSRGPASAIVALGDGRIVLGGMKDNAFALTRLGKDLSIDATFGTGGVFRTPIGTPENITSILSMAFSPNGKLVAAGSAVDPMTSQRRVGLVQYIDVDNSTAKPTRFDFDGDGKADVGVFRPDGANWYLYGSHAGFTGASWGASTDTIVPEDFDGDGKTDLAVYREGTWWIYQSAGGASSVNWGNATDVPVPADYDGDGKADLAIFRNGMWWIYQSGGGVSSIALGQASDVPVPGDYDGDGKADAAVFRNGSWLINRSSAGYVELAWGSSDDKPVPADYDGDDKTDLAIYRNGSWWIMKSLGGNTNLSWGNATDIPVPADYDGDGSTDCAVFRDGMWWIYQSSDGALGVPWGLSSDRPVSMR